MKISNFVAKLTAKVKLIPGYALMTMKMKQNFYENHKTKATWEKNPGPENWDN